MLHGQQKFHTARTAAHAVATHARASNSDFYAAADRPELDRGDSCSQEGDRVGGAVAADRGPVADADSSANVITPARPPDRNGRGR